MLNTIYSLRGSRRLLLNVMLYLVLSLVQLIVNIGYCIAGVDKRVRSTSLYHCRQCSIVLEPRSDRIDYTVVCFMTHNCCRKTRLIVSKTVRLLNLYVQGRRSLWDRGDTSPQYLDWGDIITNVPPIFLE